MEQNKTKSKKQIESNLLNNIGLSPKEAEIYETLLKLGKVKINSILSETKLKRTTIYSILDELVNKNIVEKDENHKIAQFRAKHPYTLKSYLEDKSEKIKTTSEQLEAVLPNLISLYNTAQNMPGVKFYEGKEGIKKTLNDSLNSKTEILTIADIEAVEKYIADIEEEYVKQRNKKGITKRLLVLDTPQAREMEKFPKHFTADTKYCKLKINPFNTAIQIYDNKVVFITMTDNYLAGMIIENQFIYSTQKALFEFIWKSL